MTFVDKNLHTVLNRQRIDPPSSKAQKASTSSRELVYQPQLLPITTRVTLTLRVSSFIIYSSFGSVSWTCTVCTRPCSTLGYLTWPGFSLSIPFSLWVNFLDPGFSPLFLCLT